MNAILGAAKAHTALIGGLVTAVSTQFGGNAEVHTWLPIVIAVLTALGVYAVPNAGTDEAGSLHAPDNAAADPSLTTGITVPTAPALTLSDPHPALADPDHATPQDAPAPAPVAVGSTPASV